MKTFLLTWNAGQSQVWQQHLLEHLDSIREIRNWFTPFAGTVLLVVKEDQTASAISHLIHNRFPELLIAVTPIDESTNGWMPKKFWELLHEPRSSGRWDRTLLDLIGPGSKK